MFFSSNNQRYDIIICVYWFKLFFFQVSDVATGPLVCVLEYWEGFYCLKSNHPYYHQIQGQFHLCNKNCGKLIVWITKFKGFKLSESPESEWTRNIALFVEFHFSTFFPVLIQDYCLVIMHLIKEKKSVQFLAHLSWKLKWAFLITCRPSSVCLSVCLSVNFSQFHLLLQNHWAIFN